MKAQDIISILITFAIGMVAGGYLYVTGFASYLSWFQGDDSDQYAGLVIQSESYGECEMTAGCMEFQVLSNGQYRALFDTDVGGKSNVVKEGRLPRPLFRTLLTELNVEALEAAAKTLPVLECKYGMSGTNFRFAITRDTVTYRLDTCSTDIDYDGALWLSLKNLWNHLGSL